MLNENQAPKTHIRSSLSDADKVDIVCDEFEAAWVAGKEPKIEDYLGRCEAALRETLLMELLQLDYEIRAKRGESITREMYERQFPKFLKAIAVLPWDTISVGGSGIPSAPTSSSLIAGSRIAHFELLEEIGWGAFGVVWRARDERLGRIVAVKFPRQDRLTDAERERFLREGRAAAKLRHPNIVTLFDVGEDQGRAFIVAELIEGVNLRQWLDQRQPNARESAEMVAQLAEALHHAHEQGVIHRDLKPANVLVDREGRPHITDFGLAKMTADTAVTVEGHILGTPAYMSPEQALGDVGRIDRRTDVYGLGAVLYELLTRQPPFTGSANTIVHEVIHVEPRMPRKILATVPHDLETVCLKAMDKEPSRRYPSAQEMAVDLRRYLRGESIIARRASLMEKSWRWLRRRPAVAAAIILPLIVLAAASAIVKSINDRSYREQGYQQVHVMTEPPGAKIAIVPIDKRTGEPSPNPDLVIRPWGRTPVTVYLKPGEYFIEAARRGEGDALELAEDFVTLRPPELVLKSRVKTTKEGYEEYVDKVRINLMRTADVIADMIAVPIDEQLRRKHPLLPELLYVDARETTPAAYPRADTNENETGQAYIDFVGARAALRKQGKRLASASEYDALLKAVHDGQVTIDGLSGGLAEWTTTKFDFPGMTSNEQSGKLRSMHLLRGFGDPNELPGLMWLRLQNDYLLASPDAKSPEIGFRGVRSGAPRFVTP